MNAEFKKLDAWLEVLVSDEYSFPFFFSLIDRMGEKAKKNDRTGILVDMTRVAGIPKEMERFELGVKTAEVLHPPCRILVLAKAEAINKFGEDTAHNRGATILVTTDREAGISWLTGKVKSIAPVRR